MSDREIMNAKYCNDRQELLDRYPQIHKAYERIQLEQFELFSRKMLDYGKEEEKIALTGLWFRMNDKIQRLKQLVLLNNKAKVTTESVKDTFQDLSIYGIIAQIVKNGDWK